MNRLASLSLFSVLALVGCPGNEGPRTARPGDSNVLATRVAAAVKAEATGSAADAYTAWMSVLSESREVTGTPGARDATLAALDALTGREVFGLEPLGSEIGLAQRIPDGMAKVAAELDATLDSPAGKDPMVRSYAALARVRLAMVKGDGAGVVKARRASGCATEATIVGPFPGAVLGPLVDAGPVDGGNIAATYPKSAPLAITPSTMTSAGRGCEIDITGSNKASGLRYAVVDVEVKSPQTIKIGLDTSLPAKVFVGGKQVVGFSYGELIRRTARFGNVQVQAAGTVRVVVKLAAYSNENVEIFALGEDGSPLTTHAAPVGNAPTASIGQVFPEPAEKPLDSPEGHVSHALGLYASGDVRLAEATIADVGKGDKASPAAALVYARTLVYARDIPVHRRLERQRAAYDAVLASWPNAWEAIVGRANIVALQRRGGAGEVEAIADARTRRDKGNVDPLVDAYLTIVGDGIYGVREDSLARFMGKQKGTFVGYRLGRFAAKETDDQQLKADCDPARPDLGRFDCASARFAVGDHKGVLQEIQRLRVLSAEPKLATEWEISTTLKTGGVAPAKTLYDAADPSDRSMRVATAIAPAGAAGLTWLRQQIRTIEGDARSLLDVINARRAAGDTTSGAPPAGAYDTKTRALVAEDRKKPAHPEVGTLILEREEKYDLEADGFLHATVYDVRRLQGTQDVESNAVAYVASTSGGIGYMSRSVHRIFKSDGTIVEPDRIAAAQAGAELSQIEPGDYVELVSEGWFLPRADGAMDLDTSDLLPGRTAVAHATVAFTAPGSIPLQIWTHPELGKGSKSGDTTTYTLNNHDVRRLEKGQAPIDAQVALRMGTWGWERLGRDARESVLADEERLPEVSAWIASAVGKERAPTVDLLVRLSKAAKKALPRVGYMPLGIGGLGGPQTYDARTVLLDNQGSRVELVKRALDELGVKTDVVWAETLPYSSDPKMVARPWRFSSPPHAILVAYVAAKEGAAVEPVWLDLDVDGAPPPPGRTSPELRGRMAITTKGEVISIPANPVQEPDLATIDVTVDDTGRGKGTFALMLRGRDAQDLSSILEEEAGEDREDALRAYVLAWVPNADVVEPKASAETYQVLLTAKIEIPSMLTPDGTKLALAGTPPLHSGANARTMGASYAGQAKRTTALTIKDAIQWAIHRVVRLPAGTAISTPLPAVDVKDKATGLEATRKVKVDGATVIDDFAFSLPTGVVAPTAFDAFSAIGRQVDDGFMSVVRVASPSIKLPNVGPVKSLPAKAPTAAPKKK